jgi:hypothetical protein
MCLIPYATPVGEISFCAYNTGIGWRQIVEGLRRNPTVAEWHHEHGRHPVFANPEKKVPLPAADRSAAFSVPENGWLCPRAGSDREAVVRPPSAGRLAHDEPK